MYVLIYMSDLLIFGDASLKYTVCGVAVVIKCAWSRLCAKGESYGGVAS